MLGDRRMRIRRVKIHSGCVDSAHVVFEARRGRRGRAGWRSVDASWSLARCGAARGCASMMEKHGGGFPLQRLAMRKANIKDPGAMSLAGAIRRAAEAVAAKEKELLRKEWSGHYAGTAGDAADTYESPYGDGRDPVCELRWLDLGSNHINDPGAAALGDALGPNVPITRLNLRDNQVGASGADPSAMASRDAARRFAGWTSRTAASGAKVPSRSPPRSPPRARPAR